MARSTPHLGQRGGSFLSSIATLAAWRWRQQWLLLLITGVGMITAIMMVCSIPLLSGVMLTAGLRGTLRASPRSSQMALNLDVLGLAPGSMDQISTRVTSSLQKHLGTYTQGAPRMDLTAFDFEINQHLNFHMDLYGVSIPAAAAHLNLLQGELPHDQGTSLEIAFTPSVMAALHVHVGSTLELQALLANDSPLEPTFSSFGYKPFVQTIPIHVVGSIKVKAGDPYWFENAFELQGRNSDTQPIITVQALVSQQALLRLFYQIAPTTSTGLVYFSQPLSASWYYTLDLRHLALNQLDDLTGQLSAVQSEITALDNPRGDLAAFISRASVAGQVFSASNNPSILEKFRSQVAVVEVPALLLALQITCLLLFFVSVMAGLLVDRQAEVIAVLRSRGASGRQVLGSLVTQSLGMSVLTLLAGPPLALLLVYALAARLLPTGAQDALDVITRNPWQELQGVVWYAIAAAGVILLTMILSLYRAARMDILSVRREAARSTRRPLWQRLRLDLWGLVIALSGYAFSLYLASTTQFLDPSATVLVASPLNLIAPVFLLLAGILFFVRFFPTFLHLVSALAGRGRGASAMLALAHMARTPRQPMRMALLLGLAIAFSIFSLVFSASQAQRSQDVAAYRAGADFSGDLPSRVPLPLAQETALYTQIAGVDSATAGYVGTQNAVLSQGVNDTSIFSVQIRAVDSGTFARTALWTAEDSSRALPDLMGILVSARAQALQRGQVPALVDTSTWNTLHLHTGAVFTLQESNPNLAIPGTQYVAIGEVAHIPTVDDSSSGGLLVDFSTFQAARASKQVEVQVNHIWLRTSDDPALLTQIRTVLSSSPLSLENLNDRRELLTALMTDPLAMNLLSILGIGATAALLLALLANVLVPTLSARSRLTSFAILRALGTAPRQVMRVLIWEQGIVFAMALILGGLFGALLSLSAVPNLIFTSIPASYTLTTSGGDIFAIQRLLPAQVILPLSVSGMLLVLAVICALALSMIGRIVLRPVLGQALRISED